MWIPSSHQCHSSHLLFVAAFALILSHWKWKGICKKAHFWLKNDRSSRTALICSRLQITLDTVAILKNFMMFIHKVAQLTILMTKVADLRKKKTVWIEIFFFFLARADTLNGSQQGRGHFIAPDANSSCIARRVICGLRRCFLLINSCPVTLWGFFCKNDQPPTAWRLFRRIHCQP